MEASCSAGAWKLAVAHAEAGLEQRLDLRHRQPLFEGFGNLWRKRRIGDAALAPTRSFLPKPFDTAGDSRPRGHPGDYRRAFDEAAVIFGAVPPRIYIATKPVDFRKGLDGLAALVKEVLKLDPFCGAAFIFPGETGGQAQDFDLGRLRLDPDLQAARRREVPLAKDRGRGDASVARASVCLVRGLGLDPRQGGSKGASSGGAIKPGICLFLRAFSDKSWCCSAMIAVPDQLPDDIGALKALVMHWAEQASAKGAALAEKDAELARVQDANARLWETLRQLQRAQFGRKSERLDPDQLNLAMEETEQAIAETGATDETSTATLKASPKNPALSIAARCRPTCRGKRSSSSRKTQLAPAAVAPCMRWAKTAPSGWM